MNPNITKDKKIKTKTNFNLAEIANICHTQQQPTISSDYKYKIKIQFSYKLHSTTGCCVVFHCLHPNRKAHF